MQDLAEVVQQEELKEQQRQVAATKERCPKLGTLFFTSKVTRVVRVTNWVHGVLCRVLPSVVLVVWLSGRPVK